MANEPFPRFASGLTPPPPKPTPSRSAWDTLTSSASNLLGLRKPPELKKLTPDQQSKLDADIKAKDERVKWVQEAEFANDPRWKQSLKTIGGDIGDMVGGFTGYSPAPSGMPTNRQDTSRAIGEVAGVIDPITAGAAAMKGTAAVLSAGLPFAHYVKKILPYPNIFHGSPLATQIEQFNPMKKQTHDVLGWLQHGAENPAYSGGYGLGLEKHSQDLGSGENAAILPLQLGAKNILDLVDPTADDMAAAIQAHGKSPEAQQRRAGLIKDWKRTVRNRREDPNRAVSREDIDPRHHHEITTDPETGRALYTNETEMFKNLPAIKVAESLKFTPEDFGRTQFDAIRYNDMQHKSFAWPDSTPVYSPLGHDYTPTPPPLEPDNFRFISGDKGIEDVKYGTEPGYNPYDSPTSQTNLTPSQEIMPWENNENIISPGKQFTPEEMKQFDPETGLPLSEDFFTNYATDPKFENVKTIFNKNKTLPHWEFDDIVTNKLYKGEINADEYDELIKLHSTTLDYPTPFETKKVDLDDPNLSDSDYVKGLVQEENSPTAKKYNQNMEFASKHIKNMTKEQAFKKIDDYFEDGDITKGDANKLKVKWMTDAHDAKTTLDDPDVIKMIEEADAKLGKKGPKPGEEGYKESQFEVVKDMTEPEAQDYLHDQYKKKYALSSNEVEEILDRFRHYKETGSIYPKPELAIAKKPWAHHHKKAYSELDPDFQELPWLDRADLSRNFSPYATDPKYTPGPLRSQRHAMAKGYGAKDTLTKVKESPKGQNLLEAYEQGKIGQEQYYNELDNIVAQWGGSLGSNYLAGNPKSSLTKSNLTPTPKSGMLSEEGINQFIKDATIEFDNLPNLKGAILDKIDDGTLNYADMDKIIKQWKKSKQPNVKEK